MAQEIKLSSQWKIIYSFIIAVIAFVLTLVNGPYNMMRHHLCNGQSKVEYKYKPCRYKDNVHDPFNFSFIENFKFCFGEFGLAWFIPLAPTFY